MALWSFAEFGVCYVIALGPIPHSRHPLEKGERPAHAATSLVGEAAQHRCGVPRMSVPVREEPAIENDDTAYVRPAHGFALFRALKPASQELQNDKRGEVECDQRRGLDTQLPPDGFDKIGALGGRISVVFGLVAVTHADII